MKNIFYIPLFAILFLGCKDNKETENTPETSIENKVALTKEQLKNIDLVTQNLEEKSISSSIVVNGKIDVPPQNLVSVSMPLGGYLKTTKLLPGMHFAKGEIIATMEDQQYIDLQQEYLTTKAKLEFAQAEYERQKELNQSQASSNKVFQQATSEYKSVKIAQNALAEKLKLIHINPNTLTENTISKSVNIYAPISGFVSKVNVNIGKYVNPSDVLFELINPKDIYLNLKVYEKDLSKLAIGQKVVAYSNSEPENKHICKIILFSRDVNTDNSAEVYCGFEKMEKKLAPGMYMNATIELKSKPCYALPEEAIVNFETKNYIFEATGNNEFLMKEVQLGESENKFVEIINSSDFLNKKVVTKGAYTLLMKLKNKSEE